MFYITNCSPNPFSLLPSQSAPMALPAPPAGEPRAFLDLDACGTFIPGRFIQCLLPGPKRPAGRKGFDAASTIANPVGRRHPTPPLRTECLRCSNERLHGGMGSCRPTAAPKPFATQGTVPLVMNRPLLFM